MALRRRMFRRVETVEKLNLVSGEKSESRSISIHGSISGGSFRLELFKAGSGDEKIFECALTGTISISESEPDGFSLVCLPIEQP